MASIAQPLPAANNPLAWLWRWLRDELTPYPGRLAVVTRMVISATLIMVIGMTFRIPYAWQGAIYALLVSRENPRATVQSSATILLVTGIAAAYTILSMKLVVDNPPLHFLWIISTLFLSFYVISALPNYMAAVAFVNTTAVGIPLWDRHVSAETNVEDTLWLCLAVLIAVVVTGAVEFAFVRRRTGDEILSPMTERLGAVEDLLNCYAVGCAPDPGTQQKIERLSMVGTSMLRRILRRSNVPSQYSVAIAGVAVLIGRLVDLAATLAPLSFEFSAGDRTRFRDLASSLANIRRDLINCEIPARVQFKTEAESTAAVPLLGEMEHTVTLITEVFAGSRSAEEYVPSPNDFEGPTFLYRDAFVNPEHLHFALKGGLAAGLCYVIYTAIDWQGISTAVTTCMLTALSTIGSSRQKQVLRFAGAVVGGFLIGMGAQIFILTHVDSIVGFILLFVLVTALSAWVLTSSARLSYFGVQVALAFYLVNVEEFRIRTSLGVARDRVVGILLGLFMMWFIFDRLWSSPASVEMKRTFSFNLRLIAQFAREPLSKDLKIAIARSLALRETINSNLDKARAVADGVLFEFGPTRRRNLEVRSYIRQLQPQLRTLFVLRNASLKYRLQLPGYELPERVHLLQRAYDERSARILEEMADRIDGNAAPHADSVDDPQELLNRTIEGLRGDSSQLLPGRAQSLIRLLRSIDGLTTSLASEVAGGNWQAA